ncbi:MAG TPA: BatA and WFA domain-containing protein [Gemmatimonadales bacterium]|nr:BatA and WFA domain-containing protein [Gemmatimonadales bacterium]
MGLGFLAPLFLAAMAGVAIPVLIHLTHRPRENVVPFPSLIFLRRIPFRSVRRRKIRHWWLLALRAAAVLVLAAAFARPFLASANDLAAAGGVRERVILLDRSLSMAYGDRWARAVAAARDAVQALGPEDRGALVAFAETGVVVAGPTSDQAALTAALESLRPGFGATRLSAGVALAEELLAEAAGSPEVVLISDLQRAALADAEDFELPAGTRVTVVSLAGDVPTNLAVQDLAVERQADSDRERIAVSARVANTGTEAATRVPVRLELDGVEVAARATEVPARGATSVRFEGIPAPASAARLVVRAGEDPLPADNARFAVVTPGRSISVALVTENPGRAVFVRRALEVGADPRYTPRVLTPSAVSRRDLDASQVALFLEPPAGGTAREVARGFLTRGAGILIAAGSRDAAGPGAGADPSAGPRGPLVERLSDNGGRLGAPDYDHPVFQLFRTPRSGDLAAARFFRYRRVEPAAGLTVVARFDDGAPALLEASGAGQAKVLWWSATLDDAWSDFPLQPVFLPFLHQAVLYLAGYEPPRLSLTVGEPLDLSRVALAQGRAQLVVESPSGQRTPVAHGAGRPGTGLELAQPGYYVVRVPGASAVEAVAVNLRPEESDLEAADPAEVERRLAREGGAPAGQSLAAALPAAERERRQGLWWYLLVGVLSALMVESVLANRLPVSTEVTR